MSEPAEFVTKFIARHIHGRTLEEDEDIFETGFVTSLMAMQLVTLIEKRFGILFEDEDLKRDNFRSIRAITSLVERRIISAPDAGVSQ